MISERHSQDWRLEELLEAGSAALAAGKRRTAHNIWRTAAVANPYDERVWVSLLQVLNQDDDRKVCLENIIAINPLNTDARRQLRQLVRRAESQPQALQPGWLRDSAPNSAAQSLDFLPLTLPSTPQAHERGGFDRAILAGVGIGVLAVALGVGASVLVYGGVLPSQAP